jgi:hypothetical protein
VLDNSTSVYEVKIDPSESYALTGRLDAKPFAKVCPLTRDSHCDPILIRHYFVRFQDEVGERLADSLEV